MINYLYVHVNNDYSGSSYAMKAIIESHELKSFCLATDFNSDGFLKSNNYANKISIPYTFMGKGIKTIFQILRYSFLGIFKILFFAKIGRVDVIYINTIHPWIAGLIGWLFNKKVIYHVHEYYINPSILVKFYLWVMIKTANEIVFVSEFTKEKYIQKYPKLKKIDSFVKFTPVRFETLGFKDLNITTKFDGPIILIASPKIYKGVEVFVKLAKQMPNKLFKLYLNGDYFFNYQLPKNLEIFIKYNDLKNALREASICLNLTQKNLAQETFGLTIWESLTQGTPVIVPDVGGPLEIIDSSCGISCDTSDIKKVINGLSKILENKSIYSKYCHAALKRSIFLGQINNILKISL